MTMALLTCIQVYIRATNNHVMWAAMNVVNMIPTLSSHSCLGRRAFMKTERLAPGAEPPLLPFEEAPERACAISR